MSLHGLASGIALPLHVSVLVDRLQVYSCKITNIFITLLLCCVTVQKKHGIDIVGPGYQPGCIILRVGNLAD
jgi:hypothetical protein